MENSIYKKNRRTGAVDRLFVFLFAFYLLWRMPIVSFYMNTYIAMGLLVCFAVLLLFLKSQWTRETIALLVFSILAGLLEFANDTLNGESLFNSIWSLFLLVFPVIGGYVLVNNRMNRVIRKIIPVIIAVYSITAITTYIGVLRFPGASRILAADSLAYLKYYPLNIGGFEFIYSLVLLHPLIIFSLRKIKKLYLAIPFSALVALCVTASEYTMGFLLFILSLVSYLLPMNMSPVAAKRRARKIVILVVCGIIFIPAIFSFLSQFDFLGSAGEKLLDLSNLLQGELVENDSDIAIRQNIYLKSWNTFLARPILGSKIYGSPSVGGHSYVLDTLGNWGLVGVFVVCMLFNKIRRYYKREILNCEACYCATLFLLMVLALWFLNPKIWLFELCFIAPIFLYYIENIDEFVSRRRKRRR